MNDGGDYRTALATPGLFITLDIIAVHNKEMLNKTEGIPAVQTRMAHHRVIDVTV